jgi:hypothetical protein
MMKDLIIADFPHQPPEGYSYEFEEFNSSLISIWLKSHKIYDYNLGKSVRTIWGFYSPKKKEYYAPINSSKRGDKVELKNTRAWSSMPILRTPLEKILYG